MKSLLATVCFLALTGSALGQAAVEGALTHALSGATSTAAGKALGQVGNQLAGRLGQQTSNVVSPRVTTVRPGPQKGIKVPAVATQPPTTNTGSLIASIQGGETSNAKTCASQNPEKNASSETVTDCKVVKTSAATDAHPSEITLPAPK
jgi:hypothetical protein